MGKGKKGFYSIAPIRLNKGAQNVLKVENESQVRILKCSETTTFSSSFFFLWLSPKYFNLTEPNKMKFAGKLRATDGDKFCQEAVEF